MAKAKLTKQQIYYLQNRCTEITTSCLDRFSDRYPRYFQDVWSTRDRAEVACHFYTREIIFDKIVSGQAVLKNVGDKNRLTAANVWWKGQDEEIDQVISEIRAYRAARASLRSKLNARTSEVMDQAILGVDSAGALKQFEEWAGTLAPDECSVLADVDFECDVICKQYV